MSQSDCRSLGLRASDATGINVPQVNPAGAGMYPLGFPGLRQVGRARLGETQAPGRVTRGPRGAPAPHVDLDQPPGRRGSMRRRKRRGAQAEGGRGGTRE